MAGGPACDADRDPDPSGVPAGAPARPARRWRGLSDWLFGQRLGPLVITGGVVLVLFVGFRTGLMIYNLGSVRGVGALAVLQCYLLGFCYDAMPLGYILLPMALALSLAPSGLFARRGFRAAVAVYGTFVIILVLMVEVIGAAFFEQFASRLNWMTVDYFSNYREVLRYIYENYPFWVVIISAGAATYGTYRLFKWLYWRGRRPARWPVRWRLAQAAVLTGLCVLACRGTMLSHPRRGGSAWYTDNKVVSQLTMNNFFTLGRAVMALLTDYRDDTGMYDFPPVERAAGVTGRLLIQPGDVRLPGRGNPLWRRADTHRPMEAYNVVVLLMEGLSGPQVGALGYWPSETPEFDALCCEGLFFDRMYAVGARTSRGMVGVLCGHPDLRGQTVLKRPKAIGKFISLPRIFRRRGYRTMFLYGGNPEFDNMGGFLAAAGVDRVIGQAEMQVADQAGNWGVPDEITLHRAHEAFLAMGRQPFFAVVLTVSNHEPFTVPAGRTPLLPETSDYNKRINAYRYADWALGEFLREAQAAEYFERTIFVLVADHGRSWRKRPIIDVPRYRVPCLFYAPGIVPARRVGTVASQTDIAPTLLALLGGSYEHCFMGRDLLTVPEGEGFAFLHEGDRLGWVRGDRVAIQIPSRRRPPILYRLGAFHMQRLPADTGGAADRMKQEMLSYYRMASHLTDTVAYGPGPPPAPAGRRPHPERPARNAPR